jgi:hypothetical protein
MKNKTGINFTKATLLELPIPEKRTLTFCDTKEKRLSLYVTLTGHKSFMVRKRVQGQDKRAVLDGVVKCRIDKERKKGIGKGWR